MIQITSTRIEDENHEDKNTFCRSLTGFNIIFKHPCIAQVNCETVDKDTEVRNLESATQDAIDALHGAMLANVTGDSIAATDAQISWS